MSKASGGTRNYSGNPKTMSKRESEFQAIVSTGNYKIENSLKSAATQGAEIAILIQNTKAMTKEYVKEQISMYLTHAKGNERGNLKEVIVVGLSGNVHRHKL